MSDWMARTNAQDEHSTCENCYMKNHYSAMVWIDLIDSYLCKACFLNMESENDHPRTY